jgi:hypothetical protein
MGDSLERPETGLSEWNARLAERGPWTGMGRFLVFLAIAALGLGVAAAIAEIVTLERPALDAGPRAVRINDGGLRGPDGAPLREHLIDVMELLARGCFAAPGGAANLLRYRPDGWVMCGEAPLAEAERVLEGWVRADAEAVCARGRAVVHAFDAERDVLVCRRVL